MQGDLRAEQFIPDEAKQAFRDGDDYLALQFLTRDRNQYPTGSLQWAVLERLVGLVLIHILREVEGTFALKHADTVLDQLENNLQLERPSLSLLE